MKSPESHTRAYVIVTAGVAALLVAVGTGAWWLGRVKPPPLDAAPMELLRYASTSAFAESSLDQKRPYVEKLETAYFNDPAQFESLPQEARELARRQIGGAAMDLRVQKYLGLKSAADRKKFLDEQIDQMQKRMLAMAAKRLLGGGPARPPYGGPPSGMSAQQQKEATENRNSVQAAAHMQFIADMATRASERGIPMPIPIKPSR